jgi:uncharacterized protein YndB with AHSA1/START domain
MKSIKQTYVVAAPVAEVWRALTEPDLIKAWSGAEAKFEPTVGVEYSLWDGSITGVILEVEPHKMLVQSWKPDDWNIDDSVVTFTLTPDGKATRIDLLHENVEEFDYAGTTEGWDQYYLGAIKRMFEAKPRSTKPATLRLRSGQTKAAKKKKAKGKIAKKKIVAKNKSLKPKKSTAKKR